MIPVKESHVTQVEPYLYNKKVKDMMSSKRSLVSEKSLIRDVTADILRIGRDPAL